MQVGFTMLEAGFFPARETVNVRWNVLSTHVCAACSSLRSVLRSCLVMEMALLGSMVFPTGNSDHIRKHGHCLSGVLAIPIAFADTCLDNYVRCNDRPYEFCRRPSVQFLLSPVLFILSFGHWAWGPDGFSRNDGQRRWFLASLGMNFHDFAGSTWCTRSAVLSHSPERSHWARVWAHIQA